MKQLITAVLMITVTGCATPNGVYIPAWDPHPTLGTAKGTAWAPQSIPGSRTYVVNGQAVIISGPSK